MRLRVWDRRVVATGRNIWQRASKGRRSATYFARWYWNEQKQREIVIDTSSLHSILLKQQVGGQIWVGLWPSMDQPWLIACCGGKTLKIKLGLPQYILKNWTLVDGSAYLWSMCAFGIHAQEYRGVETTAGSLGLVFNWPSQIHTRISFSFVISI